MHDTPIRVDHVGIAVASIDDAESVLRALGCEKLTERSGPDDAFRWAYYRLGGASRLELVEPTAEEGFVADFLDEYGPGLHHVTLEVVNIDAVVAALEDADLRVVDYAEHGNYTEAFVSPRNPTGTLFQLMEYHDTPETTDEAAMYIGGEPLRGGP